MERLNVGDMYQNGEYLKNNPTWDIEDAPWKADLIFQMIQKNNLDPKSLCEVGCGSGEILHQLQRKILPPCVFSGYDISPQAFDISQKRANQNLSFHCENFIESDEGPFDLILLIDIIEHLEDYFSFLRAIKNRSNYKILHIPLEMFALSCLYPKFLLGQRKKVGHLHHFSKEIALQMLRDLGFEIVDYSYTAGYALPRDYGMKDRIMRIPRRFFYPVSNDITVRAIGGYSLLILAR